MGDRSLLARVDACLTAGLEQKRRHIPLEKGAGLWIHHIKPVVVDQHRLLLSPVRPALPADFRGYPGSDLTWKGCFLESFARLAASRARDVRHLTQDPAYSIFASPKKERSLR